MKHIENNFKGLDGKTIYYQAWLPEEPKAIVQIFHGFGEHSGRYGNVVNKLVPEGYAIYANDHRGHGKSEGRRNHVKSFEIYADEAYILTKIIRETYPNLPLFVLGHSMGSLVGHIFALKYQNELAGLILSGSGTTNYDPPKFIKIFALVMAKIIPTFTAATFFDPNEISYDKKTVEDYMNDPLVHYKKATAALGACFMTHYKKVKPRMKEIQIPVLMQSGAADNLMLEKEEVFNDLGSKDKVLKVYDGCKHEVYNEAKEDRESALNDLLIWLNNHI
ncbi:MAG: lysophospholipase [Candidatus Heimdallarchaeaceae archaeon]